MRKRFPVTLLLILLFAVVSCKKNDNHNSIVTAPPANTDSGLNKNVVIIDSTRLKLLSDTAAVHSGHLEYAVLSNPQTIHLNDIIVGQGGEGYLRKVAAVDQQANKIIVESAPATMEDVFNNARFGFNTTLDSLKEGRVQSGYQFDVSGKTLFNEGPVSIVLDKGIISIDGNWHFGFSYRSAHLDSFQLSCNNAQMNAEADLTVSASQAVALAEHRSTLGKISKTNIFWIGEVPVIVTTEIELQCIFSANIAAQLKRSLHVSSKNTANISIQYANAQWTNSFTKTTDGNLTTGESSGHVNAEIKLALIPSISFRLYGILDPYASLGLQELVTGNAASPSLDWDFYAGAWMRATTGVKASVLGKSLFNYEKHWDTDTLTYQTPYKIEKISGDNQPANMNQFLAQPVRVRVLDNRGGAQSNVPVYFDILSGNGSVETTSVLSDKDGYAQTRWKPGPLNIAQILAVKIKKADGTTGTNQSVQFAVFVNPQPSPVILTYSVITVTQTNAYGGGDITNDGGLPILAKGLCWSTHPGPDITDFKSSNGMGKGSFSQTIPDLLNYFSYYVRAYAITSNDTTYGNQVSFVTVKDSMYTDKRDGQTYPFRHIGSQVWMTRNMNFDIPTPKDDPPVCCSYNDDITYALIYGRLYDWSGASMAVPEGWHLPSPAEYDALTSYLSRVTGAGSYQVDDLMKDSLSWDPAFGKNSNASGFSALPAGWRYSVSTGGIYTDLGLVTYYWTRDDISEGKAIWFGINNAYIVGSNDTKKEFLSVRCIRN